jgi:hypothetical protein
MQGVFCDFLSIYQQHDPASCPDWNSGRVVKLENLAHASEEEAEKAFRSRQVASIVDEDGVVLCDGFTAFTTALTVQHEGSYDTAIQIKAEGGRVMLSGNVGRFGRPDNVWGYPVQDCVRIANAILRSVGLPEFTWGQRNGALQRTDGFMRHDAVITRVDLTQNYCAGSPENLSRLLHYMGGMHVLSKAGKSYDSGVTWGEGSKWWYAKLYDKHRDLVKNAHASPELVDWVRGVGLARFEISLKTRYLAQNGLNYVGAWESDMGKVIFGKFSAPLKACDVTVDAFEDIPGRLGELAIAWRNGVDLRARLPRNTFYRYRKQLKAYGVDISERCDVSRLPMRFETVSLFEAVPPAWYDPGPSLLAA